jgi:hypothetical protein
VAALLVLALAALAGGDNNKNAADGKKPGGAQKAESQKTDESRNLEAIQWFEKKPADAQKKIADAIRKDLETLSDPWLDSVRAYAARAAASPKHKDPEVKLKAAPDGSLTLAKELPFPIYQEYVFGARVFRAALGDDGKAKNTKTKKTEEIGAMLAGYPPDVDAALAACLADLNQDSSADDFALFLETWRNGDESFYRALDRTAGTKGGVFFFDAMIFDFTAKFVKTEKENAGDVKKSLQKSHDALHAGFLTYRQYRAMREAYALSLLLHPEAPLPTTLTRYEDAKGKYSLRNHAEMLLAVSKGDFAPAIALLTSTSKPMPSPLWSANYEPLAPFFEAYAPKFEAINAAFVSPDKALAAYRARRDETAKQIREIAQKQLTLAGCPAFKNSAH